MATNLALDDDLINEALRLGEHRTKKQAVTEALEEYVAKRKRREVTKIFGRVDWDPDYDYKEERRKR